jgi:hypothetical protein
LFQRRLFSEARGNSRRLSFHAVIEANTAFRLLTWLESLPIVGALQSVGDFSRAFSEAPTRNCFGEITLDS